MANVRGITNLRNSVGGKQSLRPPKSPLPSVTPLYADHDSSPCVQTKGIPRSRDGQKYHQRTSSESILIEEQPSWLDDLLNEPETPAKKASHRRSSSDSFAYLDMSDVALYIDKPILEERTHKGVTSQSLSGSDGFNCKDMPYGSNYTEASKFELQQNRRREDTFNFGIRPSNPSPIGDSHHTGSSGSISILKQNQCEVAPHPHEDSSEKKEGSHAKHSQTETDQKRVKQQFAQRSRVQKLQYIAELERNAKELQAEESEASAELQFLDQQNLILNLENNALKQRLDSLAQEKLLKHLQQGMLEREIVRLRALCQQQLQQPTSNHSRSSSKDLDSQFASLCFKHKEASSGWYMVSGNLRI